MANLLLFGSIFPSYVYKKSQTQDNHTTKKDLFNLVFPESEIVKSLWKAWENSKKSFNHP